MPHLLEKNLIKSQIEKTPIYVKEIRWNGGRRNVSHDLPSSKYAIIIQDMGLNEDEYAVDFLYKYDSLNDNTIKDILKQQSFFFTCTPIGFFNQRVYLKDKGDGTPYTDRQIGMANYSIRFCLSPLNNDITNNKADLQTINDLINQVNSFSAEVFSRSYQVNNSVISQLSQRVNQLNAMLTNTKGKIVTSPTDLVNLSSNIRTLANNFFDIANVPLQLLASLNVIINNTGLIANDLANQIVYFKLLAENFYFNPIETYASYGQQIEMAVRPVEKYYYAGIMTNLIDSSINQQYKTASAVKASINSISNFQTKMQLYFQNDLDLKELIDNLVNKAFQVLNNIYNDLNDIVTYKVAYISCAAAFYNEYNFFDPQSQIYQDFLELNGCNRLDGLNDYTMLENEVKFYRNIKS